MGPVQSHRRTATGQPYVRLGSWRPWRHYCAAVPPAILTLCHRIHAIVNGSANDVSPGSAGVTLESVIGLGIFACQIGWNPPRPDFSFAGGYDSFLGTDPLLPAPNPLPICATAPVLDLYHHTADASRRPKPFNVSGLTLLPIRTFPLLSGAPYPPAVSAFSPSTSIPEKILWNCSVHALLNAPQTFPLFESQSNHSFVREPYGGRQLWEPGMRLLGLHSLGLTIYL